jgi:hypothetical protein
LFESRTSAIPRAAALDVPLSDILLRCLEWPESSILISIALQSEDSDASSIPLQTLAALWEVIDTEKIPVFRVQISEVNLSAADTTAASQPTPRQRQHNHPILALEAVIDKLPDNETQIAPLLFQLVREGHSRSHEHIKDLEALFAPVR